MVRLVSLSEQRWGTVTQGSSLPGHQAEAGPNFIPVGGKSRVRRMRGFISPAFSTKPSGEAFTVTVGILRKPRLGIGLEETDSLNLESSSYCKLLDSGSGRIIVSVTMAVAILPYSLMG